MIEHPSNLVLYIHLRISSQPYVWCTCGKCEVGIFFIDLIFTNKHGKRNVSKKKTGFNEERVLSVYTGCEDKIQI